MTILSDNFFHTIHHQLHKVNILCIGDVMLDRFVSGDVKRISPEAPIPILKVNNENNYFGGAGNVARNITSLHGNVTLIGIVGSDKAADDLHTLSYVDNITAELICDNNRPTSIKTRYVSEGQQILRCDHEETVSVDKKTLEKLYEKITSYLPTSDIIILSDYDKGVLTKDLCAFVIDLAKKYKKRVIVDPKSHDFKKYHGATIITPNMKEFLHMSGMNNDNHDDMALKKIAQNIIKDNDIEYILLTRSEKGMSLFHQDDSQHFATIAQDVYDVAGAGDTVVGSLAVMLAMQYPIADSVLISNIAAGVVVAKSGTATTNWQEIERAYHRIAGISNQYIIDDWDEAKEIITLQRKYGKKVGFTNGCFDILHQGHIHILNQARSLCDFLIVAVNSDDSVRMLKGNQRPIQSLESRMKILSTLDMVDMVISFNDETPFNLIMNLRPDMIAKGADYAIDDIIGAKEIREMGGDVHQLELLDGFSTSNIIEKILNK